MELTPSFLLLLQDFRPVFTAPSFFIFIDLVTGWALSCRQAQGGWLVGLALAHRGHQGRRLVPLAMTGQDAHPVGGIGGELEIQVIRLLAESHAEQHRVPAGPQRQENPLVGGGRLGLVRLVQEPAVEPEPQGAAGADVGY
jgi:hypothetical protein